MNGSQMERLAQMRQEELRSMRLRRPLASSRRSTSASTSVSTPASAMHSTGDVLGRLGARAGTALVKVGTRLLEANERPQSDIAPRAAVSQASSSCC